MAQFEALDPKPGMTGWGKPYFLAWTTTPWTLPSNTALCVGPGITYVAVRTYNKYSGEPVTVVLAKDLVDKVFNPKAADIALADYKPGDKLVPYEVVATYAGPELVGMKYRQLIPWMWPDGKAFEVIAGDYVSTEDGTGIVHIAGTFGADDKRVSAQSGISPMELVNRAGKNRADGRPEGPLLPPLTTSTPPGWRAMSMWRRTSPGRAGMSRTHSTPTSRRPT